MVVSIVNRTSGSVLITRLNGMRKVSRRRTTAFVSLRRCSSVGPIKMELINRFAMSNESNESTRTRFGYCNGEVLKGVSTRVQEMLNMVPEKVRLEFNRLEVDPGWDLTGEIDQPWAQGAKSKPEVPT